jgi:hypothetical protein
MEEIIESRVPATRWRNTTGGEVRFVLNVAEPTWDRAHPGKLLPRVTKEVVLAAGEEIVLPSAFDTAIAKIGPTGAVVSGLAPMLKRIVDGEAVPTPIHPALEGRPVAVPVVRSVDPGREARLAARLAAGAR